nr:PREDICTED: uncharacterized protein LOC108214152 [Daucus carota subsp. sativus]XP_017241457.1 PREDICTED: uncharacterized protein LOC108214152 [Daucus carota subsp. sativus]XP_017241458.1 PREDICTED: uncharacterized protein LOC108214152 [Daucus carota subsp. sativus]XP_017241459.1 PREDICTED: uncharacterized protein LOC108214152 [Daucus carota subsp. sativus]XP_017241460.1 PREDICTED: uncharacterized protein LOC108214152 [Daucus carota subsp. sativus]XP_017241461.1 PREDICTED: uncharacterized pro
MKIQDCRFIEYLARMSPGNKIGGSLPQSIPFSNLTKLKINNCHSLKYLFCNSVARCLNKVQKLKIENCHMMEEVVLGEGTSDGNMSMPELRKMTLIDLPRLIHFYKDNTFSGQIQPLFNQTVEFPLLEELDISGLEDITDIWGDNNGNAFSFFELKKLNVWNCNKLKNVIPPAKLPSSLTSEVDTLGSNTDSVAGRASEGQVKAMNSHNPNKKLQIFLKKTVLVSKSVCRRTPTITEENLNDPSDILVQVPSQNTRVCPLVEMSLQKLPCLEKTGLNFEDPSGVVSTYPYLEKLNICECNRLENVFISSRDANFKNLEDMSVTNCIIMREIIGAGDQKIANGIVFPKLCSVKLTELLSLTSFWGYPSEEANSHKVEFPNLKSFELSCGKITSLEMIEFGSRDGSIFRLEKLDISCDEEIQIPNQWLPHLNNLERLSLRRCWSDELKSLHFAKLKVLLLQELSCSTIFSFPDFERLQQLRGLVITKCNSLEAIVEVVEGEEASDMDTETVALVQLESVHLEGLPKLKSFMHTKPKNLIPSLEHVEVEPSILFMCPVFGNFQQLKRLQVIDCRLLEGIVEVARGYETDDRIITFPKLSDIHLRDLPNLQNFSPTTSYSFNMPKLFHFHMFRCPRVENKPLLQIIAQRVLVYSDEHPQGIVILNLNEYTRRIKNLESVGESSNSHQDVEMETITVAEEEDRVVEQEAEEI